jgi:hypothetical protein
METEGRTDKLSPPTGQPASPADPAISTAIAQSMLENAKTYRMCVILGICVGALFCVAGFVLLVLGLTGNIEWIVEASNFKSRLTNASPGALFAVMGMVIIWRYKPDISDAVDIKPTGRVTVQSVLHAPSVQMTAIRYRGKK